jgi:hypothetical protein
MKKYWFTLLLLFIGLAMQAQAEFASVDAIARSTRKSEYAIPENLAKALCKTLKTDREKARVLFTWVALNIRYDLNAVGKEGPDADSQEEYEAKRVTQAYRKGRGVCMDYALLYKQMADAVGLECAFVTGHSKGSVRGGWGDHAWNAVKINGKWELLDATWGSGHVKDDGKFHAIFQAGYFFTPPRIFALDHFPEEEKWQCLDTPISKNTFKTQAAFSYGDLEHDILDAKPFGAPLTKGADGRIEIQLKMQDAPGVFQLKMGGRELKFERSDKDGWTSLRFSPGNGKELQIWGGERTKKAIFTTLLGIFPVK